ncbi:aldo/keto reductase [Microbacterium sp. NRRL B-14842]|uniref:aldo/keto reductase n=1 Tax=Microbacterium sp. NRRL B-14842 TaxID=3162881 RepID=UPI003D2DCDD2
MRRSLDGSLARLGADRVDVLHLHDPLDVEAAFATALPALVELRDEGVVRAISVGLGRLDPLERYVAEAPLDVVMEAGRLTLLDRNRPGPAAADRGGPWHRGARGRGCSTSASSSTPVGSPFFEYKPAPPELRERALRLQAVSATYGVRLADAAVQFPLRHGADAVVVGARTPRGGGRVRGRPRCRAARRAVGRPRRGGRVTARRRI